MKIKYRLREIYIIFIGLLLLISCVPPDNDNGNGDTKDGNNLDYKQEMRDFVQGISQYIKTLKHDFIIIPQNGHELVTKNGESDANPDMDYLDAIDGAGQEDLFYGYDADDVATATSDTNYLIAFLNIAESNDVEALVTDYCSTHAKMDDSYTQNNANDYISFAADHRDLDNIPGYPGNPYNENTSDITNLAQAKNFLYILDPTNFGDKGTYLAAIDSTNYDAMIIDLYYEENNPLSAADVITLKTKATGEQRLVIAYMSIGEAEDYRYYWQDGWNANPPGWIEEENPEWEGNYIVQYWREEWQDIIYGNDGSYLKKIYDASFDGVYLDIIDAFEYFE